MIYPQIPEAMEALRTHADSEAILTFTARCGVLMRRDLRNFIEFWTLTQKIQLRRLDEEKGWLDSIFLIEVAGPSWKILLFLREMQRRYA